MTDQTTQPAALTPIQRIAQQLEAEPVRARLAASLDGLGVSPDRFARAALAALNANPFVVQRCTVPSVIAAILTAASLRLELDPRLGQAYVVPRGQDAVLQVGYRGWLQLAWNTGKLAALDVGTIHEKDRVSYKRGTTPTLDIEPPLGDRGKVLAYYACAQWAGGGTSIEVMTVEEVVAHRDRFSDAWKRQGAKSPWGSDFDEMAKKTVLMKARKTWPVSLVPSEIEADGDGNATPRFAGPLIEAEPVAPAEAASSPDSAPARRPSRLATFAATPPAHQ